MKYLVLECHPGYAVVLDQQGQFLRVANQNFEVGQSVQSVVPMLEEKRSHKPLFRSLAAVAACLCVLIFGAWQVLIPYGTVRLKINPDIKVTVNRMDYVIDLDPLNTDGRTLLYGYKPGIQKIDQVLDQLADRAQSMGFLPENSSIQVTVQSTHKQWQSLTQNRLIAELEGHMGGTVTVLPNPDPIPEDFDDDIDDPDDDDDIDDPDDPEDGDDDTHDPDDPEDDDDDTHDPDDPEDDDDDTHDPDDPEDGDDDTHDPDDPEDDDDDTHDPDDPEDDDDDIHDPDDPEDDETED